MDIGKNSIFFLLLNDYLQIMLREETFKQFISQMLYASFNRITCICSANNQCYAKI